MGTEKLNRNAPCHCGSGRKYKKCCEKKDLAAAAAKANAKPEPKNSFREQLAKENIAPDELLKRDGYVSYLRLKTQKQMLDEDYAYNQAAIEKLQAYGKVLAALPKSEGRQSCIEENNQNIARLTKQRDDSKMNRAMEVILAVLEEKFGPQVNEHPLETILKNAVDKANLETTQPPVPELSKLDAALGEAHASVTIEDDDGDEELVGEPGTGSDEDEGEAEGKAEADKEPDGKELDKDGSF